MPTIIQPSQDRPRDRPEFNSLSEIVAYFNQIGYQVSESSDLVQQEYNRMEQRQLELYSEFMPLINQPNPIPPSPNPSSPRRMTSPFIAPMEWHFPSAIVASEGNPITKEKKNTILSEKLKYLDLLTYETALKEHPFVEGDICLDNLNYQAYTKKQFKDGVTVIFKNLISGSGREIKDILNNNSVSLEEFKNNLRLGYLKSNKICYSDITTNLNTGEVTLLLTAEKRQYLSLIIDIVSNNIDDTYYKQTKNKESIIIYHKFEIEPNCIELIYNYSAGLGYQEFHRKANIPSDNRPILDRIFELFKTERIALDQEVTEHRQRNEIRHRKPAVNSAKHRSPNKKGLYVSHSIPFSCEIECYAPSPSAAAILSHSISKDIGLCHDGSLTSGLGHPIELQTPILEGKRGEICVAELCTKLVNSSFKVDKTCGLHIHLDGEKVGLRSVEMTKGIAIPEILINLYLAYRIFDEVIVSLLPSTRRLNQYCAAFRDGVVRGSNAIVIDPVSVSIHKMKKIKSLQEFENYWYKTGGDYDQVIRAKGNRYTISRYFGVNFHSLLKDNHLEIRYHSGTLNYEKILYWTDLHGKIVEKCVDGTINLPILEEILAMRLNLEQLTQHLIGILDLNKDTVDYLLDRQEKFKGSKETEEILINKTKKSCVE